MKFISLLVAAGAVAVSALPGGGKTKSKTNNGNHGSKSTCSASTVYKTEYSTYTKTNYQSSKCTPSKFLPRKRFPSPNCTDNLVI